MIPDEAEADRGMSHIAGLSHHCSSARNGPARAPVALCATYR
jgi:hypothetical protein